MGAPLRSSNRFKAYRSYAIELKLGRMIQVISPQTRSESDFPVSPGGRCWGAPFEIFKSIHSLQYLSDCDETWYDNTKLSICTIGMSRICVREGPRISKFFADVICACYLVSPSQKSPSSRSER